MRTAIRPSNYRSSLRVTSKQHVHTPRHIGRHMSIQHIKLERNTRHNCIATPTHQRHTFTTATMYHFGYPFDYAVPTRRSTPQRETDQPEQTPHRTRENATQQPRSRVPSRSRTTASIIHTGYPFDYAIPAPIHVTTTDVHSTSATQQTRGRSRSWYITTPRAQPSAEVQPTVVTDCNLERENSSSRHLRSVQLQPVLNVVARPGRPQLPFQQCLRTEDPVSSARLHSHSHSRSRRVRDTCLLRDDLFAASSPDLIHRRLGGMSEGPRLDRGRRGVSGCQL